MKFQRHSQSCQGSGLEQPKLILDEHTVPQKYQTFQDIQLSILEKYSEQKAIKKYLQI